MVQKAIIKTIKEKIIAKERNLYLSEALDIMDTDLNYKFEHQMSRLRLLDLDYEFDIIKN